MESGGSDGRAGTLTSPPHGTGPEGSEYRVDPGPENPEQLMQRDLNAWDELKSAIEQARG